MSLILNALGWLFAVILVILAGVIVLALVRPERWWSDGVHSEWRKKYRR